MVRVLFVCMGNICRSPAAETVFRSEVLARGLEERFEIDSAGTISYHAGEPADARMRKAAAGRGYAIDGTARGFDPADFERFDWIVTMDEENFADISAQAPSEEASRKVRPIREWIDLPDVREVPDPYYGGARGFDRVLDILEAGCGNLLEWLVLRHGIAADTP